MKLRNPIMNLVKSSVAAPFVFTLAALVASSSWAGRPLAVDDANVDDVGTGHVEVWLARQSGPTNSWTVAPAYGLMEGVEVGASLARDTTNNLTATAIQAKFRITPSQKSGCNVGASVGVSQADGGAGNTPFVNGLLTCNGEAGALHLNLGANRAPGAPTLGTWGLALERELGAVTAHVEYFGQEQSSPTLQFGLRTMVLKNLQLDGSVGYTQGESVFSLGVKFLF